MLGGGGGTEETNHFMLPALQKPKVFIYWKGTKITMNKD